MKTCCCDNKIHEQIEFPIEEDINQDLELYSDCFNISNLDDLKLKIIQDFLNIVNKLECGIQPDLEFLLQEISIIYIKNE